MLTDKHTDGQRDKQRQIERQTKGQTDGLAKGKPILPSSVNTGRELISLIIIERPF